MGSRATTASFNAVIETGGRIRIPADVQAAPWLATGKRVHVTIAPRGVMVKLSNLGVTEDEVDSIARLQRAPREDVIAFLLAEGSLSTRRGARRRAKGRSR